jgi:hypothetical protein
MGRFFVSPNPLFWDKLRRRFWTGHALDGQRGTLCLCACDTEAERGASIMIEVFML